MMKFKKFLAAAMTGAMMFGLVATAAPVVSVYAATTSVTLLAADNADTIEQGGTLQFSISETLDTDETLSYTALDAKTSGKEISGVTISGTGLLLVADSVEVDTKIYVTAIVTLSDTTTTKESDPIEITVKAASSTTPTEPSGSDKNIKINYSNYTLEISLPGNNYAFVTVCKMDKEGKFKSESKTYSCKLEAGKAVMDLSFLKATAVQMIHVFGDKTTEVEEYTINAQPAKLSSVKYVNGEFTGKIGGEAISTTNFVESDYVYRGQYGGEWLNLGEFRTIDHTSAGSTIVIRKKATDTDPAGAEVKVKIAAAATGPKVAIDYVKGTVSFPKNTEYYNGEDFVTIEKASSKVWKATLEDLKDLGITDEGGVLLVRTAEDTAKNKPASNVTPVRIPKREAASVSEEKDNTIVVTNSTATVTWTLANSTTKPAYQFKANDASFDFSVNKGETWKTVKNGSSYSVALTDSAQEVWVRLTGVKADSALASQYAIVTVPKKGADDPGDGSGDNDNNPVKADAPIAGTNAGEVKIGDTLVLTIARDGTTDTTINFTVKDSSAVATLEYRVVEFDDNGDVKDDTTAYGEIPTSPLTEQPTKEINIQIRVKAIGNTLASDPLTVTIDAVSTQE